MVNFVFKCVFYFYHPKKVDKVTVIVSYKVIGELSIKVCDL